MLEEGRMHQLGVIAVDEAHMVSDQHRGFLLELTISKVRAMNTGLPLTPCVLLACDGHL
jgi:replicative superfamily II helicase